MSKKYLWISLFAAAVLSANAAHATGSGPGHHGGHGHHAKPHFKPHFKPPHGPAFPGPHRPPHKPPHQPPVAAVPELSAEGALAALALLMGVATMVVPRSRRTPGPDSLRT